MSKANRRSNEDNSTTIKIRNYPASLIYDHTSPSGAFQSLSFKFHEAWCSLILPADSISQSINRNGEPIEGRFNISLGDPNDVQTVSVQQNDSSYKRTPMFNRTIFAAISENRQEYLRSIAI